MMSGTCQHFNVVGEHPLVRRLNYEFRENYGVRTNLRRVFGQQRAGQPSLYAEGDWVQVLDRNAIGRILDARSRTRGLLFLDYQWAFCGGVYRVQKVMTRILDDSAVLRPISRTVLLEGVDCGGITGKEGCGRFCPIWFRDEWIRPALPPGEPTEPASVSYARVRSLGEIRATLDWRGRKEGLMFMPEMARHCGERFRVLRKLDRVFECNAHTRPRSALYILEGVQCSGSMLERKGSCDRRCSVLWDGDWLQDEV
jgi:hypothetical protein